MQEANISVSSHASCSTVAGRWRSTSSMRLYQSLGPKPSLTPTLLVPGLERERETVAMRLACKGIPEVNRMAFCTRTLLVCILTLILPLFMFTSSRRFYFLLNFMLLYLGIYYYLFTNICLQRLRKTTKNLMEDVIVSLNKEL